MGRKFKDQSGRRFGRLFALSETVIIGQRKHVCICDCGNKTFASPSDLSTGKKRSCGCLRLDEIKARSTTHGQTALNGTVVLPEYKVWQSMKARCADKDLPRYGGRGIEVCAEWRADFLAFYRDMGPRPSSDHSLERLNNNGNYCKENCDWVSRKAQARNRKTNSRVYFLGRSMSLAEACEITGINYDAAKYRVKVGKPFNQPRNRNASDFGK